LSEIRTVLKRDGREVPFDKTKIADAIYKAAQAAGGEPRYVAEELAEAVAVVLENDYDGTPPHIERIQDLVERVVMETGHIETAKAYILYRERRAQVRDSLRVTKPVPLADTTRVRVSPGTRDEVSDWDREKIILALEIEAQLESEVAREIAHAVEQKILASGMTQVSTSLVRELVDNELLTRGLSSKLERQALIGIPKFDLDQILFARGKANHKVVTNNPEAINLAIAEHCLRQYALDEVFSQEVADAHLSGMIHIHDLGYPTRIYLANHSLEYLKKFGLTLETIDVSSAPARHPDTLASQLFTFLGAMQSYAAGPQGVDYLNVLYAPFLDGFTDEQIHQEAQRLIFDGAQHSFSRGGQTLFTDLNIYPSVPGWLRKVEAIGPGGQPTGRPYGDYEDLAQRFARGLLEVWREGDQYGGIFCFPKCDFHVSEECFADGPAGDLLRLAAEVAAHNGVPVFVFDRPKAPRLGPPLRHALSAPTTPVEEIRSAALQSITINLPQAAYRAGGGDFEATMSEVEKAVDLAVRGHLQKRKFVGRLSASSQLPLWQLGRTVRGGKPYFDLAGSTCTVGLLGLNECLACAAGCQLHQGEEAVRLGLKLVQRIQQRLDQHARENGIELCLEETPSENAARRLAIVDARAFPMASTYVQGDPGADAAFYTNGVKVRPDAVVTWKQKIGAEGSFHPLLRVHALTQVYVAEQGPGPDEICRALEAAAQSSEVSQLAFTPMLTHCHDCRGTSRGESQRCPRCDAANVTGLTRIADYFSRTADWNRSKLAELRSQRWVSRLD